MTPAIAAKAAAFKDIAEECERENQAPNLRGEYARKNLLIKEHDVCFLAGIDAPDFRVFNGGHNKKK